MQSEKRKTAESTIVYLAMNVRSFWFGAFGDVGSSLVARDSILDPGSVAGMTSSTEPRILPILTLGLFGFELGLFGFVFLTSGFVEITVTPYQSIS